MDKEALVSIVLDSQLDGEIFELEIQFHRDFHNGEMNTVYSFLDQNYSKVPRGEGADSMAWRLNGSGNFDIRS